MPIEMVGAYVEQHGDVRPKASDRRKLKARDFDDEDGRIGSALELGGERSTDIPREPHVSSRSRKHRVQQGCGRGLSFRARDRDDRS